ncbi:MAG: ABC transporter permease [Gemmatimonadales bacterium]|jgi:putative ABC transport system permease protein
MTDREGLPDGVRRALRLRRDLRNQITDEVETEIRFHIESRIEDLVAEGMERGEAERRAREEFGDLGQARRTLRRESARTERRVRRTEWLQEIVRDLRYGWRKLWAKPGFAAVAILTLALGIGANTAIFSVVDAVLLRPLPYPEPDRLVRVWEIRPDGDDHNVVSRGNYMDWRDQAASFETLGAHSTGYGVGLGGEGEPVRINMASLTPGAFRVLGVAPLVGRTFSEEEGVPGNANVAVLSYGLWQRRFGGNPDVVGQSILVDDERYSVLGVMPASFEFPEPSVQLWVPWPLGEEDRASRRSHNLQVIGRLDHGVSLQRAQAGLDAIAARLAEEYPQHMQGWGVNVQPYRADLVSGVRPLLMVLLGVVALVLLLACANLANLLLARAMVREREVAVRGALGAGRGRLVRQFLTEALLIAVLGGALGFALTAAGLGLFVSLAPDDIPLLGHTRIEPAVFAFAAAATLLATLLFGLLPALRASASDPAATLRAGTERGGGLRQARLRSALLVTEVALSVVLLSGAGLLVRSFMEIERVDYGFDPENVLITYVSLPSARYSGTPQQVDFFQRVLKRIEAVPGVRSAAGTTDPPALQVSVTFSFAIEGRPRPGPREREDPVPLAAVTPGYFRALGIPLIQGRALNETDGPEAPAVLVINQALAKRHWPGQNPVGQRISFQGQQGPWLEIVGVVGDTRHSGLDRPTEPAIYIPFAQKRWTWMNWLALAVRTDTDPEGLAATVRDAIWEVDGTLALGRIARLTDLYGELNARRRFATVLLSVFAGLALILGTVGVYGVLAYAVAQRTREIGVRIALGAQRASVAATVVRQGMVLALAGVVLGIPAALGLSRFLDSLVFGISTRDPVTFVAVPLLLLAVAGLAAYLPARRATRVDPLRALRME